ncbi:MAG TPA: hypothetical protein VFA41_07635 [Ktedonobacteraceae bacterium]|jgi:hypothetical protein|nr:hypothetical protein [Ktedonobacteraceae bacterium]
MEQTAGKSEVARLRQRIAEEEAAAWQALYGLAMVTRHELITARMTRGAERVLRLIEEGRHAEAQALLNTENWCEDETSAQEQWAEVERGAGQ